MMVAFGIACLCVYAVNAWAAADAKPRYADAAGVSALLCLSFGMSNALVELYGFPDAIAAFPVVDAILTFMVWRAWKRHSRPWKLALMGLLVSQLVLHAVAISLWNAGAITNHGLYNYALLINATFAGQLLVVGSAGVGHAVARFIHWLSVVRRVHSVGRAK